MRCWLLLLMHVSIREKDQRSKEIIIADINDVSRNDCKRAIETLLSRLSSEQVFLLNEHRTVSNFHPFEYELIHALGVSSSSSQIYHIDDLVIDFSFSYEVNFKC